MVPALRARAGDVQLAERVVGEDFLVGPQQLLETLVEPKRDERLFNHWPKLSWSSAIRTEARRGSSDHESGWSIRSVVGLVLRYL